MYYVDSPLTFDQNVPDHKIELVETEHDRLMATQNMINAILLEISTNLFHRI